jgi:hypothetical protein
MRLGLAGFSLNFGHLTQSVSDHPFGKSDWLEDALPLATFQGFEAATPPGAKLLAANEVLFLLLCLWNFGAVLHSAPTEPHSKEGCHLDRNQAISVQISSQ